MKSSRSTFVRCFASCPILSTYIYILYIYYIYIYYIYYIYIIYIDIIYIIYIYILYIYYIYIIYIIYIYIILYILQVFSCRFAGKNASSSLHVMSRLRPRRKPVAASTLRPLGDGGFSQRLLGVNKGCKMCYSHIYIYITYIYIYINYILYTVYYIWSTHVFHLFKFATRICRFHAIEIEIHLENLHTLGKKCSEWKINGNFRILKWRYVSTIFLAIFCGDISLKFRPEK